MSRKTVGGVLVFVLALVSLIFGENLFQQITGRSAFRSPDNSAPPIVVVVATTIPTPTQVQFPSIPSQPSESVATSIPTPTIPTPESSSVVVSDSMVVSGKDSDGEVWSAPATGLYRILYTGGAYSPWPNEVGCDPKGCWKTTIFVYRNRDVLWLPSGGNMVQPGEPDLRIGDDSWQQTPILAEEIARLANGITIDLEAGEYLTFIAIDGKDPAPGGFSAYSEGEDHEGGVNFQISLVSQ